MNNDGLLVEIKIKRRDGTVLFYADVPAFQNYDWHTPRGCPIVSGDLNLFGFEYRPAVTQRPALNSAIDKAREKF